MYPDFKLVSEEQLHLLESPVIIGSSFLQRIRRNAKFYNSKSLSVLRTDAGPLDLHFALLKLLSLLLFE